MIGDAMPRSLHTKGDPGEDVVGTLALLLNIGAVISAALWVGMAGGAYRGAPVALAGVATVLCLGASIACFAAGGRDE